MGNNINVQWNHSTLFLRFTSQIVGLIILTFALFGANQGQAATLLSVGGVADSGVIIESNGPFGEAIAVAFTLDEDVENVEISAAFQCLGTCLGGLYLQQNALGSGASLSDTLFGEEFPTTSSISYNSLSAGLYFIVLEVFSGSAIWEGSTSASEINSYGTYEGALFAENIDIFAPDNEFEFLFNTDLLFSISGDLVGTTPDISTVPLPAGILLFAGGIIVLMRSKIFKNS